MDRTTPEPDEIATLKRLAVALVLGNVAAGFYYLVRFSAGAFVLHLVVAVLMYVLIYRKLATKPRTARTTSLVLAIIGVADLLLRSLSELAPSTTFEVSMMIFFIDAANVAALGYMYYQLIELAEHHTARNG